MNISNTNADNKPFNFTLSFYIECYPTLFESILQHYKELTSFYGLVVLFSHSLKDDTLESAHLYRILVAMKKTSKSRHLNVVALRNIFLNDLKIIDQLAHISDVEFQLVNEPLSDDL